MLTRWTLPALAAAIVTLPLAAADAVPTFTKDVAPILNQNCVSCHRPGDIASPWRC